MPKLLACILLAIRSGRLRQLGGGLPVISSLLLETFLSGLIAPVMMIFQSVAVTEILLGAMPAGRFSAAKTASFLARS